MKAKRYEGSHQSFVMAGLVPAIHVFLSVSNGKQDVDARHKSLSLGRPKAGPEGRA
jgi:hypothetical protein